MIRTDTRAGRRSAFGSRRLTAALLLATLSAVYCAHARSAPPAAAGAVAGAKAAVRQMSRAKTTAEVAQCLTNESAAVVGAMMAMPLMMQYSFAPAGGSARQKAERARFQALVKRYGLDKAQGKGPESPEWRRFAAQGRRFLVELDRLQAGGDKAGSWKPNKGSSSPEALSYRVLSPTRVAIRDPKRPKDPPMQARLEDGRWRLHLPMDAR